MHRLKRRKFIKNVVMAGIASTVTRPGKLIGSSDEMKKFSPKSRSIKKVIVGGAGLAGLCCAYELVKSGHEVVVLEASGRHGGHILTAHDGLSDGLYGDFGQEHITKPGYDKYWQYVEEFKLTALPYPRRKNELRRINGKFYTEEMLHDPVHLSKMGFNQTEAKYLMANPWWDLKSLYLKPYLDRFKDEYQPFGIGYDHLDNSPVSNLYKAAGASDAAQFFLGGKSTSGLYELWMAAILNLRGVPLYPTEIFRLKDGNQMLPNAFAKRLGSRVWLNSPITSIRNEEQGVVIVFRKGDSKEEISADYFVNCIPLPALKNITFQPALPPDKQFLVDNLAYDSYQRFVFQAGSKFWLEDKLGINMHFDHPDLWNVWQSAEEVDTHRVIILGTGPGGISPQRALAAFRSMYPGKKDTIEQVISKDWTKETFSPTCERLPFPVGELHRYWPNIMKPYGRMYFAGAYADNLNWGTEAATRSANRVAQSIDNS